MRWEPFKDLLSLQDRMNRLFEESLARGTAKQPEERPSQWSPSVDILETETEIILLAEVPGVDLDDIELQIRDNVLTLRGERTFENTLKKEHYYRIERAYGGFGQTATVTVTPAELVTLSITPPAPTIPKGQSQQSTATGIYTDGTSRDLTGEASWTSSDGSVATITSPGGLATAVSPGQVMITATVTTT